MELYQKAIEKFQLKFSIPINEINDVLIKLIPIYNLSSINEAFFYFVKNEIGGELEKMGHDCSDFLAWLTIKKRDDIDWYYYQFDSDEDYYEYKGSRKHIYDNVTYTNLLTFLEQSCSDFVADKTLKIKTNN